MAKKSKVGKRAASSKRVVKRVAKAVKQRAVKPARAHAGAGSAGGPFPVTTGRGASVAELAGKFKGYFESNNEHAIFKELMSPAVVSCEGVGSEMEWRGLPAVLAKGEAWMKEHVVHGARCEGPYVGATGFSFRYTMDVEVKASGMRFMMDEIAVYSVKDGAIVREEFMYGAMKG